MSPFHRWGSTASRLEPLRGGSLLFIHFSLLFILFSLLFNIAIKPNRANAMPFKVREFVNTKILKSIYYAIFDCDLNNAETVWGQNRNSMNQLIML